MTTRTEKKERGGGREQQSKKINQLTRKKIKTCQTPKRW